MNYDYRWRLTLPQVEMMMADLPHTLFKSKDKSKVSQADVDDATRKTIEAYNRKKLKEGFTVDEVFRGDADNI